MGHDVFVSHSSHDKAAADAVCAALEANGIRCWIAPRDIILGERWAASILKGVSQCRLMVLVFSGHTNGSNHIRNEVERAVHHGIPIAPIRIEDALPADDLELFLSSSHWMDALTPPLEKHLQQLAAQTRVLLEMQGQTLPPAPKLAPAATMPTHHRRKLGPALLGAALLIGVAAWIWHGDLARLWSNVTTVTAPNSLKPPASIIQNTAPILPAPAAPATLPVQVVLPQPVVVPPPETPEAKAQSLQQQLQQQQERLREQQEQQAQQRERQQQAEERQQQAEERQQLAQLRQQKIAQLLATAKADDSKEKGHDALPALDDLLKLDPANAEASALRDKINAYYDIKRDIKRGRS